MEPNNKMTNPKMNMGNYTVGKFNKRASAVATAIIEEPGIKYNPIFVFAKPGLGKTHLLQAIGDEILKNNSAARVLYTSTEMFVNELCECLHENKMQWFRSKYRTCDVLLLDDFEFVDQKPRTQEEMLYTIEELLQNDSQVVIASDRTPHKMKDLNDRLDTLLKGCMIVSIDQPERDERVAILNGVAKNLGIEITTDVNEVIDYISDSVTNTIAELVGVFKREVAFAELGKRNISVEGVKRHLQNECADDRHKKDAEENAKKMIETTPNNHNEMIKIGDVLHDYVPDPKDMEYLIETCYTFTQFVNSLGSEYAYAYAIDDYLDEIIVSFCMESEYRGKHTIEFSFVCSLDEVRFEAKFKTPRLHDGTGGAESLACDVSMEVHDDEMCVYRDDYDPESDKYIRWTVEIYLDEDEINEQMLSDSYKRLMKASTYIIRKMESAYWQKYGISNISPDKTWRAHIENDKWPYSYEVYDGTTVTGKRAFFIENEYGEVYIDKFDSIQNKVYIGHYYYYPVDLDEFEDARETYEIEADGDRFFIKDTSKSEESGTRVIGEGGRVTGTEFLYCKFKEEDCSSTCIISRCQDKMIQFFELEEDDEFTEIARIEKLDQTKPYKDMDETQMNANHKVRAQFNNGMKIAFIYAIGFLTI